MCGSPAVVIVRRMVATGVAALPDATDALGRLDDETLPALPDLLGQPGALLGAALAPAGGRVRSVQPRQTAWRPGLSLTVRYDTRVAWPDGTVTDEVLVASTGRPHPGALVLRAGDVEVGVWRLPYDPWLPGLAAITADHRLGPLLDDLGVPPGDAQHRIVTYRPRRGGTTLFVKVTRPDRARALHDRHVALAGAVPVPRSLGTDPDLGLVVLEGLGGTLLRQRIPLPDATLPPAGAVTALLDRLPPPPADQPAIGWRAAEWVDLLGRLRPAQDERLQALAGELAAVDAGRDEPRVPVHGDLHDAQLLVQRDRITGLLDVDTHGTGHRLDDLANLVGHLATLAVTTPRRATVERYAARLLAAFDRAVDPVVLRYAVADVVLGLATGPFRVLEPNWPANTDTRIDLAHSWAASARRLAGRPGG